MKKEDPSMNPELWRMPTQQEKEAAKERILDERFAKVNTNLKKVWDDLQNFKKWTVNQFKTISDSIKTGSTREGINSLKEIQNTLDKLDEDIQTLWDEVFPEGRTDGGNATAPPPAQTPDFS